MSPLLRTEVFVDIAEACAHLFELPDQEFASLARKAASNARSVDAAAADALDALALEAERAGGQALEEAFVRTFELQPSCSPYAGPHLFGDEGFQRGRMLSSLRAGFERAQFDSKTELPDHVAVLLRFAARIEGPEREELLDWCLATPLVAMEKRLQDSTNPYRHLCRAARILFAANGVPEHVASTLSRTAPPPSDGGCGGTFTGGEES